MLVLGGPTLCTNGFLQILVQTSLHGIQAATASLHEGAKLGKDDLWCAWQAPVLKVLFKTRRLPLGCLTIPVYEAHVSVQGTQARKGLGTESAGRSMATAFATLLAQSIIIDKTSLRLTTTKGASTGAMASGAAGYGDQKNHITFTQKLPSQVTVLQHMVADNQLLVVWIWSSCL
mmetsp:Transcript_95425/g.172188  ORF Transcript_95425/g.172188 Transcript_95425/m.172188 type:complete len:175 (+) Transcript_95425:46-570(+)